MKTFTKPANLNGDELVMELAQVGLIVTDIFDNADGTISFDVKDEAKAAKVVAEHNGTINPAELSIEAKLSSIGLNLDDLKIALGL